VSNLIKKLLVLSVLIFTIIGLNTTNANAKVSESNNVKIQYFDENDNPINPDQLQLPIQTLSYSYYNIPAKTFGSTGYWVKSGGTFLNPHWIEFELTTRPQAMSVKAYTSAGTYKGKVLLEGNLSGWQTTSFGWLPRGYYYKFKFDNEGSGSIGMKNGQVVYN
ncbi:hypothetical protein ACFRFP_21050, partial [Bacillus subtilis]